MASTFWHALFAVGALALTVAGTPARAQAPAAFDPLPDQPAVRTLAGSGKAGIADGPATQASFMSPVDVTFADDGTLYVADRDAQRIRAVAADGSVRTLAGSGDPTALGIAVQGGFRDGPALQAQFDMPEGVLAMPDGSVLVADRKNFCIRSIASGRVTTFAGRHGEFGAADGDRRTALFRNPRSLARDSDGSVYVADWGNGVRRIEPSGRITTLRFEDTANVEAVAIARTDPHLLIAATSAHVEVFELPALKLHSSIPLDSDFSHVASREGGRQLGPVTGVAAFDANRFLTVDSLDSAVRYVEIDPKLKITYVRTIGSRPDEEAAYGSAGFADSSRGSARFNQATGIALARDGRVAVADLGNRRIREIAAFDHRTHIDVDLGIDELPALPDQKVRRVALVGSSIIWFDQPWHGSMPGVVQDDVDAALPPMARKVVVYPIMRYGLPPLGSVSLIDETLTSGVVDGVVLDLSTYGQIVSESDAAADFPDGFEQPLRDGLRRVGEHLRQAGIPFLVVVHPGPADFPSEFTYRRLLKGSPEGGGDTLPYRDAGQVQRMHDLIAQAVTDSGVPSLDLWPMMLSAYGAADRQPLFESWDHHLSPYGRRLIGDAIAKRLSTMLANGSRQ